MSRRTTVWFGRPSRQQPNATTTTSPSSQVELAVVFKDIATYRPYTPGTGPPLRPITLIPVRDSTAYIRDEFFVPPPLSQDGKKRLQYVVGWSDLPAARLVVDAERVADYVSPAAYEDWCAARAAERDEEERRWEEEENVRAVAEAEARERGMLVLRNGVKDTPRVEGTGAVTGKRKRRTKAEMAAARAETPVEGDAKRKPGRPKKDAPSLSTPSKARLEEFHELETEVGGGTETPDDEEAIYRQLHGDEPVSAADSLAEEEYDSREEGAMPVGLEPPIKKRRRISPGPALSRLLPGIDTGSGRSTPFDSSRGATSSPALPPLPSTSQAARPPPQTFPPVPQASATYESTPPAGPKKITPIQPPIPPKRSLLSMRDPPSSCSPHLQPTSSKTTTPTPKQWQPPPNMKETAITPPINGVAIKSKPRTNSLSGVAVSTPRTTASAPPASTTAITPRTGFTPAAQSATPWSLSKTSSIPPPTQSIEPAATPKPKLLPKPSPSKSTINVLDPDRDELSDVYEVLRLEGLQIRHVRGKPVRYFAVRWKGNWPPDQNPTWEPESNIPRYMTKKYLLNNPTPVKGKNGNSTLDKYLSPGWSQRKYSSVSEAFEGGDPEVAAAQEVQDEEAMEDEEEEEVGGEGDEMLLVTDEPPRRVQPTLSW
ncbi:chromo domain-containing protein [Colletotrichum kahawae]|uniref:Chromo domain-containing protein n=1 Tax=Colletotrichum kahawae TaxID=34407 RepID=A0AAD9YG39_COLKA|nr:chromo domain-containing protein [Colletotrichum kahawae]